MDFVTYGLNPWRESIPMHAAWTLLWVSVIGGAAFLVIHALYLRFWPKPAGVRAGERPAVPPPAAARIPARVPRHSLGARLFHWVMAASMLVLLFTGFLPIVGVQFAWVAWHWIAGLVLTASILFHLVHSVFWLDFWSIWPNAEDIKEANARTRRNLGQAVAPPRKFGKYPLENKLYHLALIVTGFAVIVTGIFMLYRIETPFFTRNPYLFTDMTWGVMYVAHGLSGITLIALTMAHVYFAVRPEKLPITWSMINGKMDREFYLEHHDPERWKVAVEERPKAAV
jgi:formate dehydrogenase gamma subunit